CFILFTLSLPSTHDLSSFPTRRSSDLGILNAFKSFRVFFTGIRASLEGLQAVNHDGQQHLLSDAIDSGLQEWAILEKHLEEAVSDRKSTRLNSSHVKISYAVFCLK